MEFPRGGSASARASMAEKSRRHLYGDADAQAALLLRHRLFPRAMAWNATQQQPQQQPQQGTQPQVTQQQQADEWRRRRDEDDAYAHYHQQQQRASGNHRQSSPAGAQQRQYMLQRQQQQHALDVTGAFTAQLHAFHLNERQAPAPAPAPVSDIPARAVHEAMNFARSYPLLHATGVAETQLRRQKENVALHSNIQPASRSNSSSSKDGSSHTHNPFLSGALPSHDAREKLFRTMGKWFDGSSNGSAGNSAANSRSSFASSTGSASAAGEDAQLLQHIPRKANFDHVAPPPPPVSISFASTAPTSSASFGRSFSPVDTSGSFTSAAGNGPLSISSTTTTTTTNNNNNSINGLRRVNLVLQDPLFETPKAASFSGIPLPIYAESRGTPSPTNSNSNWSVASEPRMRSPPRGPGASGPSSVSSSYGKKRHRATPAPSLAKALLTGCGAKRCSFEDCGKIAVSKGLCRGHGGGRRCQFSGCNKCAQSRSPYCWAHGGGKRCEAPNCRRSRKTKHYCVDHVDMEDSVGGGGAASLTGLAAADSDESMDGGPASTVASDVDMALTIGGGSSSLDPQQKQKQQKRPMTAGTRAKLALQLPSLNDALKRPFPSPDVFQHQAAAASAAASGVSRTQERVVYQQQFSFELPKPSR